MFIEARRRSEVINYAERGKRLHIRGQRQIAIMLYQVRHGQNVSLFEKPPDLYFIFLLTRHLRMRVRKDWEFRPAFRPFLRDGFKSYGAFPFLPAHRQQLLWSKWHQGDLLEKKEVAITSDPQFLRHRRRLRFQPSAPIFQSRDRFFCGLLNLLGALTCEPRLEFTRDLREPRTQVTQEIERHQGERLHGSPRQIGFSVCEHFRDAPEAFNDFRAAVVIERPVLE